MKVTPSNQTLILASEQRGPSSFAKTAVPIGSILKRVTIVASQPDTLVYLRADYSTDADNDSGEPVPYTAHAFGGPAAGGRVNPALSNTSDDESAVYIPGGNPASHQAGAAALVPGWQSARAHLPPLQNANSMKDGFGNALTSSRDSGLSSSLPPVQQYARTQRLLADSTLLPTIDVHA